jgi:hypothetical protein
MMIKRHNKIFEMAAKKGFEMSRQSHFASARKMMEKTGLPHLVIERVLNEPHSIRKTDWTNKVEY